MLLDKPVHPLPVGEFTPERSQGIDTELPIVFTCAVIFNGQTDVLEEEIQPTEEISTCWSGAGRPAWNISTLTSDSRGFSDQGVARFTAGRAALIPSNPFISCT